MTELAAPQISSLMEALPGIAAVLRNPVANAMVAMSRSAAGLQEFEMIDAEELLRFGVRRNLLTVEEVDSVLGELREVVAKRPPRPAPPPVKKPVKPEGPKPPHRPKGIQLKPGPRRPPPPPVAPPPPPPVAVAPKKAAAKPATVQKIAAKAKPARPAKHEHHVAKPARKAAVHKTSARKPAARHATSGHKTARKPVKPARKAPGRKR